MTQTGIRAREGREQQESVAVLADVRAERVASLRNKIAGLESAANLTPVQQNRVCSVMILFLKEMNLL